MPPLHPLRVVRARRSLVVATRVCWRTTHTNEVCISGHFRIFRSACCARKSLSRSRLLGHFRLQFPCLVTGERPRRPQDAGERPRRPQDAGERPRRPQDAGERPRRPQDAGERPRRPQDAGERPRRPQDAGERPRRPQDAGERPRRPQDAGERPYSQQDPNLSSWTRLEGVEPPPEPPFFLSNPSRACARARVRARIMRPRARFWPLD